MRWLPRRIAQSVLTAYLVITVTFVLTRYMPGGPLQSLRRELEARGDYVNIEQLENQMEILLNINPDLPVHVQYYQYFTSVLQGDLGFSIWYTQPVIDIVLQGLPWTMFIMLSAVFLNFAIAVVLGAVMAYYESTNLDLSLTSYSLVMTSVPYYIAGLLLIFVLSYQFNLFPSGGRFNPDTTPGLNVPFLSSVLYHGALPIMSYGITRMGKALTMRANSIQILGSDYVRAGTIRGIPGTRIATKYVGRNAILPLYTQFLISIGNALGGALILEIIFSYPGLGWYMYQAVEFRDYSLMMGIFMIVSLAVVVSLFIADITYGLIDPRISTENSPR